MLSVVCCCWNFSTWLWMRELWPNTAKNTLNNIKATETYCDILEKIRAHFKVHKVPHTVSMCVHPLPTINILSVFFSVCVGIGFCCFYSVHSVQSLNIDYARWECLNFSISISITWISFSCRPLKYRLCLLCEQEGSRKCANMEIWVGLLTNYIVRYRQELKGKKATVLFYLESLTHRVF